MVILPTSDSCQLRTEASIPANFIWTTFWNHLHCVFARSGFLHCSGEAKVGILVAVCILGFLESLETLQLYMVEPLLLSTARSSMRHMTARTASISNDLFTPRPTVWKGKQKAVFAQEVECLEWCLDRSSCHYPLMHSVCLTFGISPFEMEEDSVPTRKSSLHRLRRIKVPASSPRSPSLPFGSIQRRHASSSVGTLPASPRTDDSPLPRLLNMLHATSGSFSAEDAWSAYQQTIKDDTSNVLTQHELIILASMLISEGEKMYSPQASPDDIRIWGERALSVMEERPMKNAPKRNKVLVRAKALAGQLDSARTVLQQVISKEYPVSSEALLLLRCLFWASLVHLGHTGFMNALAHHVNLYYTHIHNALTGPPSARTLEMPRAALKVRDTIADIFEALPNPFTVYKGIESESEKTKLRVGLTVIGALCWKGLPLEACSMLEVMKNFGISPPSRVYLEVIRALVRAEEFHTANRLYDDVQKDLGSTPTKKSLNAGLYLFSSQGNVLFSEELFSTIEQRGWVGAPEIGMMLHAYATHGNTEDAISLFSRFFLPQEYTPAKMKPSVIHYSELIYAHAQRSDFYGMNIWLENMVKAGIGADVHVYTVLLRSFALRGELSSVAEVLDQMKDTGVTPTVVTYTTIISMLAKRKNPVAAEAIYQRAVKEGIAADARMVAALMDAHIEAGAWKGVIRAFDYINAHTRTNSRRSAKLTIDIYNMLMKAYVMIGSPFRVVGSLFSRFKSAGLTPDAYTYSLLIQSACDSGNMQAATDILQQMDRLSQDWRNRLEVNAYALTIIMSGWLHAGNKQKAKEAYDEIRTRGLQPTGGTFSKILHAYANERSEESIKLAEGFIQSLLEPTAEEQQSETIAPEEAPVPEGSHPGSPSPVSVSRRPWLGLINGRVSGLESIFSPVMDAYVKLRKPQDVQRLFREMLDAGGTATIGTLTGLLDVFRRTADYESVIEIWPQIFRLGLQEARVDPLFEGGDASDSTLDSSSPSRSMNHRANLLCIPFSIYIDALSAAGKHAEIARTWRKMQMEGFSFDSHNWNHLIVALVRAGEAERAFEVLERVILPYQKQSERIKADRDEAPEDPLTFSSTEVSSHGSVVSRDGEGVAALSSRQTSSDEVSRTDELPATMDEAQPSSPSSTSVATTDEINISSTVRLKNPSVRQLASKLATFKAPARADLSERPHDFAHSLHILQQISPAWNMWRPHGISLQMLFEVLEHLSNGRLVQPVGGEQQGRNEKRSVEQQHIAAHEIFMRIMRTYPAAVTAVREWNHKERLKMMEERYS